MWTKAPWNVQKGKPWNLLCPSCGHPLIADNNTRFHCNNIKCSLLEVTVLIQYDNDKYESTAKIRKMATKDK